MWRPSTLLIIPFSLIAAGASGGELHYDQVEFTVQAESELQNDLAEVVLAAQTEHSDPAQLAKELNDTMSWALNQVHAASGVDARSGNYQTYPVYDKNRLHHWRGAQTLVLRSKKIETINILVGGLQQRLQVQNMRFMVSPEQQRASEAQLLDQAMENFKERAVRIQNDLGAKGYRIVNLNVGGAGAPPPFPMERMAMAKVQTDSGVPVAGEAGTSRQQLSLHAIIQLQF
jgi:predicted secreted protein